MPNSGAAKAGLTILQGKQLAKFSWLLHGFSSRSGGCSSVCGGGSLNLGFTRHDTRSAVENNRAAFLKTLGAVEAKRRAWPLVTLRQVHSDIIHCVSGQTETPLAGDGLITATSGLVLAVQTADCLPVILVDPKRRAIGVFHAGWRGTLRRIVQKGVGEMRLRFGSEPRHLKAVIGPGIHSCCYEVGGEVKEKFASQFSYAAQLFREIRESNPVREKYPLLFLSARPPGHTELLPKLFLDLVAANERQLVDAGIPAKNIEALPLCTSCRVDLLFSHRAENGVTGRMLAAVGMRPQ